MSQNLPADASHADKLARRDAERVAQWKAAADAAPTLENVADLTAKTDRARQSLVRAEEALHRALVARCLVFGWVQVSQESGISTRALHLFADRLGITDPDLSDIPGREMRREERRVAELERILSDREAMTRAYEAAQARLAELKSRTEQILGTDAPSDDAAATETQEG